MNWILSIFNSSTGRKLVMSLTGLFLSFFLLIHMSGNFLLFSDDGGRAFNEYTKFMTSFPLIRVASILTFIGILFHIVDGVLLTMRNRKARPEKYAYSKMGGSSSWSSRNMGILGLIIFFFLILHLKSFWFAMKFGSVPMVTYDGVVYKDLYTVVIAAFSQWWYVAIYLIALIAIGLHLVHGVQSGFRSLGLVHPKYTPLIKGIGYLLAIGVPIGFATQPIFIFLRESGIL